MQFARLCTSLPFRRGTVVHTNLRLTAGVGVVAACLLVAGPSATVAYADPGGHGHSGHGNNNNGNNASKKRSTQNEAPSSASSRSGSDYSDDNINDDAKAADDSRPTSKVGSGRESGTSDERPSNDYSPSSPGQFKAPKVTFGDGRS